MYYTDGTYADFDLENSLVRVNGYQLNLKDDIGVKAYLNIPSFTSYSKIYVRFTVDGVVTEVPFTQAEVNANYGYAFERLVNATQMASEISIELYYDEILLFLDKYSVTEYANALLDNTDNTE